MTGSDVCGLVRIHGQPATVETSQLHASEKKRSIEESRKSRFFYRLLLESLLTRADLLVSDSSGVM